ncbi:MAG: response regulator [Polyangiaceae bacterium]
MKSGRILVVDDNPTNLKLVTFILAASEYDVRCASDAQTALGVLETFEPDLILMDLQLPDIDGLELTRRLKSHPRWHRTPIIAVTAYAMKGDEEKARAAGVDGYVCKPIQKDAFRRIVAEQLQKSGRGTS